MDSRKIIDTKNRESLLKQIEAKVKDNNVSVLEDLLENLASLDNSLLNQVSEIWGLAVEAGRVEVLEVLLENIEFKKNINVTNSTGLTPLMKAAKLDNASAVRKLLTAGAECEILPVISSEKTVLHYAIESGKARVLRVLINSKLMSLEILNELLMLAVLKNNSDAIKVLLKAGADITVQITGNSKGLDGVTALHIAASLNKIGILELLLKHKDIKKVLNLPNKNGFTSLMRAAMEGHADVVSRLIEAGANVTIQITGNSNVWGGSTALHIAAFKNKIEILELLLKHQDIREVLNLPSKDGFTPLMDAAEEGHADAVSKLIEAGADITIQVTGNSNVWGGYTALYIAASLNKIEVLELLLKHKDIKKVLNLPNEDGYTGFTALMDAASKGHTDTVGKLIEAGADITAQITGNSKGFGGYTALHIAASLNKIGILELLLKHKDIREVLNLPNEDGYTPLMDAAFKGHADAVSKLIEAGADVTIQVTRNSDVWDGSTALHMAASSNKIEILELLLKHKDIKKVLNLPKEDGYTPLMDAAEEGHAYAVSSLIEAGADVTIQVTGNSDGWGGYTALHIAAFLNKIGILELLLKHKDTKKVLNLPKEDGYTPLMDAAKEGHADAVSKLIEAGADITIQVTGNSNGWDGSTALYMAVYYNKIEVLELLLKHKDIKKVLNLPNKNGFTPLMHAASKGHADAVSKLIEAGTDITIQVTGNSDGWDGYTALHIAASLNKIEVLELLLKHQDIREVLNLPNKNGYTPLMDAVSIGHADAVSKLIEAGADITAQIRGNFDGWDGSTALYMAASLNKIGILELLLKHKDIREVLNLPNKNGYTPLMDAAKEGHTDTVGKLIEAGADITAQIRGNSDGWDGSTALYMAASLNKIGILELLLKHKDIREVLNLPNKNGYTPLMDAAKEGHTDTVGKLIEAGADITAQIRGNSKGWNGYTALHIAASLNKIEMLELLLKHKDIREVLNLPNEDGFTPLMDAARGGHTDTVSRLIEAGADITIQVTGNSNGWDGSTALYMAASLNKIGILELLLKHQDIREVLNLPNKNGYTPLMNAADAGHADAVSKLIEAGADITIQVTGNSNGWDGSTALYLAASLNKIGILELLLKHKDIREVLNLPNENGYTPLMSAASKGHTDTVSRLIEAGANVTIQITGNSNVWGGSTALHIAATLNKIKILELLLKHKDIKKILNLPSKNGFTPLMDAAEEGHADAVSKLIEAGADITIQVTGNYNGWGGYTALHMAVYYNKIEVLELLLKHQDIKKVLNLPNEDGYTPLMDAVSIGHTDTVSRLIEAGADVTIKVTGNSDGWDGSTALYIAASLNKIEVLELLLKHQDIREVLNLPSKNGYTPLMDAAEKGHADAVSKLIEASADITIQVTGNSKGWGGYTALHIAAFLNKVEVLELLLKHQDMKKVLNLPKEDGFTPLMDAAMGGHTDTAGKLIEAGADVTIQVTGNSDGWGGYTALHIAAFLNKVEVLELLLKHKDIKKVLNLPNEDGYTGFTPLMDAAYEGHADTAGKLIEASADVTIQVTGNSDGWGGYTALHIAAFLNKVEVLELLFKHKDIKKVLNLPDKNGFTPLMDAAMRGHTDTVSRLIEAGVDITIQVTGNSEWNGYTALYIAASLNKIEVLELLLKHQDMKKILNLPKEDGYTPLMDAAMGGHTDTVSRLIEAGADITIQVTGNSEWNGYTALHIAASLNNIGILELLLKYQDIKKVLNLPDKNGFTPLMCAASKDHADTVGKLIEAGADIAVQITGNSKGWNGYTALHIAASLNKIEMLELLLKHKDIREVLNLPNEDGFTPLMDAAEEGHADAVSKLIEAGADVTIKVTGNSDGWDGCTALYIAVCLNKIEVLELLLKHQDIREVLNLPNEDGFTPLMDAAEEGHADAVSKLIEAGADVTIKVTGNSDGWDGSTALYIAASLNKIEVLELLLKHQDIREVLNLPNKNGYTPLMDAAEEGHADAVSKLIEASADITVQIRGNSDGWDGYTALHIAAEENKIEVLELLFKHKDIKKVLNLPDKNGFTPLMDAAKEGHADAVGKLIEAGADITVQNHKKNTAAHLAAKYKKGKSLGMLIDKAPKVLEMLNETGHTPGELLNSRQKRSSSEVSIFSNGAEGGGKQKRRRIQTNSVNW